MPLQAAPLPSARHYYMGNYLILIETRTARGCPLTTGHVIRRAPNPSPWWASSEPIWGGFGMALTSFFCASFSRTPLPPPVTLSSPPPPPGGQTLNLGLSNPCPGPKPTLFPTAEPQVKKYIGLLPWIQNLDNSESDIYIHSMCRSGCKSGSMRESEIVQQFFITAKYFVKSSKMCSQN